MFGVTWLWKILGAPQSKGHLFFEASQTQIDPHRIRALHEEYLRHQVLSVLFPTPEEEKRRYKERDYPSRLEEATPISVFAECNFSEVPPIWLELLKRAKEAFCTIHERLFHRRRDESAQDRPSQLFSDAPYFSSNVIYTTKNISKKYSHTILFSIGQVTRGATNIYH